MKFVLCVSFYIFIFCHTSYSNEISFLTHCLNGSNPDPLPKSGESSSGSLVMSEKSGPEPWYLPNLNCSVTLTAESNFHILLTFSNISLRNSSMDNLTVYYNNEISDVVLAGQQVCSNENCEGLKFDSGKFNNLTLKFISANATIPLNVTGFKGHYTVFDLADPQTGACREKQRFLCENKHCIWYNLMCDGHNNCGDMSDETRCVIPVRDTVWGIVIIVIAILCVLLFVPMFCFLATHGTRSIVKSVLLPNQATLLLNTADGGETSGLLTSSEAANNCWPGTSYDKSNSLSYGSAQNVVPSASTDVKKKHSSGTAVNGSQDNQFL